MQVTKILLSLGAVVGVLLGVDLLIRLCRRSQEKREKDEEEREETTETTLLKADGYSFFRNLLNLEKQENGSFVVQRKVIGIVGIRKIGLLLGIEGGDPIFLALFCQMGCRTMYEIRQREFICGLEGLECRTMEDLGRRGLDALRSSLSSCFTPQFEKIYMYSHVYYDSVNDIRLATALLTWKSLFYYDKRSQKQYTMNGGSEKGVGCFLFVFKKFFRSEENQNKAVEKFFAGYSSFFESFRVSYSGKMFIERV